MNLFEKYVLSNGFESLYVIVALFTVTNGIKLNESTAKRFMNKLHSHSFAAVLKRF